MNELLTFIITILSVGFGYYLGKRDKEVTSDAIKVIKTISKIFPSNKGVGAVPALTQKEIELQNNPLQKAENEEMDKTFSEIIPK